MNIFKSEVVTQGQVLRECLSHYTADTKMFDEVKANIKNGKYNKILLAGMGSSYYAPLAVVGYLTNNVLPSYVFCADELVARQMKQIDNKTLVIAISQSGESGETVLLAQAAKEITDVLCVVNNTNSSLAKLGNWVYPIYAGIERHISNKSYQTTIAVLVLIAHALAGDYNQDFLDEMNMVADWCDSYLKDIDVHCKTLFDFCKGTKMYDFFADGASLSTAKQSALIYREGPNYYAGCMECQDYFHGWNRCADDKYVGIAIIPQFSRGCIADKMISLVYADNGKCILITASNDTPSANNVLIEKIPNYPSEIMPILENIVANTLMAALLDENPGKPLPNAH